MAIISNAVTIADAGAFSVGLGSMVLIKTITLSSAAANISFVDGASSVVLDDTYPIYQFEFFDIHPATNAAEISFNVSIDTGSNYNIAKTTTCFRGYHTEDDSTGASVDYVGDFDLAQATGFQPLALNQGNANDESAAGILTLFNPSSTTFVKHFLFSGSNSHDANTPGAVTGHFAGYANTTSAVDAIQFKMSTGNIDAGTIKMYGIKDS